MRILDIDPKPLHRIRYSNARKGGGVESALLPISRGRVDRLPEGVQAVVVASDLQGVVSAWPTQENHLLGIELADVLAALGEEGSLPVAEASGVILAGDLFSAPGGDKRGATGDVRAVWEAFSERFAWVVGVAGNHDTFGSAKGRARLMQRHNVHLLDADLAALGGVRVGGVQHIMGDPRRVGRVAEEDFLASLDLVLEAQPDVVVLHEGPHASRGQRGSALVTQRLTRAATPLVVCGHVHWEQPLAQLPGGVQVLNVDARVVVLTR